MDISQLRSGWFAIQKDHVPAGTAETTHRLRPHLSDAILHPVSAVALAKADPSSRLSLSPLHPVRMKITQPSGWPEPVEGLPWVHSIDPKTLHGFHHPLLSNLKSQILLRPPISRVPNRTAEPSNSPPRPNGATQKSPTQRPGIIIKNQSPESGDTTKPDHPKTSCFGGFKRQSLALETLCILPPGIQSCRWLLTSSCSWLAISLVS